MLDIVIPFGAPSATGTIAHSRRVISALAAEFGLGLDAARKVEGMLPEKLLHSLSTAALRKESARIFSQMSSPPPEPASPPVHSLEEITV
jgi:hypothetical protein